MIDPTYEVSKLFEVAFGVTSPVFLPNPFHLPPAKIKYNAPKAQQSEEASYNDIKVVDAKEAERLSWMGTPIVFPFTFKGGTYQVYNAEGDLVNVQMADFEMPAATLVNFTQEKVIVRSKLPGNIGTVKELYGFDDWSIQIRGICLNDQSRATAKTAIEQQNELVKWFKICNGIPVVGDQFFKKDISALSLGTINFTALERKPDVIPFEFSCFSDQRIELIL